MALYFRSPEPDESLEFSGALLLAFSGGLLVGTIRKTSHGPFEWEITGVPRPPAYIRTSDFAKTIDDAKVALREAWKEWVKWAGLSIPKE